jgi:hypothetical protein
VRVLLERLFSALAVVKNFLDNNPDGYCLYIDTEAAITKSLLESLVVVDTNRLVVINVVTVEEFRTKTLKAVDIYYEKLKKVKDDPVFLY